MNLDKSEDIEFGYEKLIVWQRSIDWADRVLTFAENIKTERKFITSLSI